MKKIILLLGTLILTSAFALAQSAAPAPVTKPVTKQKPAKAPQTSAATKPDTEIQTCITERLAAAPKLKTQGFSAAVTGGVATFSGTASNPGSKGGVSGIAKTCGAKKIVNNITLQAQGKPAPKPRPDPKK